MSIASSGAAAAGVDFLRPLPLRDIEGTGAGLESCKSDERTSDTEVASSTRVALGKNMEIYDGVSSGKRSSSSLAADTKVKSHA